MKLYTHTHTQMIDRPKNYVYYLCNYVQFNMEIWEIVHGPYYIDTTQ